MTVLRAMAPLVWLIWTAPAVCADAPEEKPTVVHRLPALSSVFPQGAQPGARLRLEVLGQHLDRASRVLFLDGSISGALARVEPTRLEIDVAVAPDSPEGVHYFRVVSPRGPSNVAVFRVGSHRHHPETEPNSTFETAERVAPPVTINARLPLDNDFDFFRFRAAAGETLAFDLRAARNGSGLDAAMILLDADGRRLEHDEDTFIWDPFFAHTFREAGEYVVAVQPTSTRNDPGFVYQLDIRRAPHLETLAPISLPPGKETEVTLYGKGLANTGAKLVFREPFFAGTLVQARGDSALARIRVPEGAARGAHEMFVDSEGLSNALTFLVDDTPAYRGGELTPPVSITGIAQYRKPERFRFRAEAGSKLVFEVRAQRFGSPADVVLRVLDAAGKAVANNDDGNFPGAVFNKDARLAHTFVAAGEYTLEVRNLWATTGENFPYQVLVGPPRPGVELMMATDQAYVYAGEKGKVKVNAVRRDGHDAVIALTVKGLPAGVSMRPAAIPAGAGGDGEIEVDASGAAVGAAGELGITGEGVERPAWRAVQVSSGAGEGRHYGRVTGAALVVAERPLFSLECAATALNLVRGGSVELKVMIRRRDGFQEALAWSALNLPAGVTVETIDSGQEWATLRFRARKDAAEGRAARVSVAAAAGGQTQYAPKISILVD